MASWERITKNESVISLRQIYDRPEAQNGRETEGDRQQSRNEKLGWVEARSAETHR